MTRPPKPTLQPRPRGTGYLTPVWTADGWRLKARFPDGAGGERTVGTYATEDEAHLALNAQVEARARGSSARVVTLTLLEWGERWLVGKGDKNLRTWLSTWRTVVSAAPFAGLPLDAVRRADIRDWVASLPKHVSPLTGKPISRQTQKHALGLVKRALAAAVDDELIEQNPAAAVKLGRERGAKREGWTYLRAPEIAALFALQDLPEKQRAAFAVAIYAGLRQGELAALRWEHIDMRADRPRLHVIGSWDDSTKTSMDRRVALLPAALAALERWHRLQGRPAEGLVWSSIARGRRRRGKQHRRGYDWGWSDQRDADVCRLGWKRCAGIARRVRFHDMRHTFASHCVSGTWGRVWSLREVGEMLGHTTEDVTRRYAHLARTVLDAAAAATTAPIAIRPESVRGPAAEPGLSRRNHKGRAVGDSNARPSAPEAQDQGEDRSAFWPPDGLRTEALRLLGLIRSGQPVDRSEGDALAADVLRNASAQIQAAGAVLAAGDDYYARLTALLELVLTGPTGLALHPARASEAGT